MDIIFWVNKLVFLGGFILAWLFFKRKEYKRFAGCIVVIILSYYFLGIYSPRNELPLVKTEIMEQKAQKIIPFNENIYQPNIDKYEK
jgi:hypothetical protein